MQTRDHFASQLFRGYASDDTIRQAVKRGILKKSDHYLVVATELPPDLSWEMILQNQCGCLLYTEKGITYILTPDTSDISPFIKWVISRGYRVGKSFAFSDLMTCRNMARQAEMAIEYGRSGYGEKIIDFRKEALPILMHQEANRFVMHPVIHEIQKYDEKNHTEYVRTLTIWLNNRMDDSATAEQMHIHRNTLYYRLHKISELFGIDLKDSNVCVQLYLSLL